MNEYFNKAGETDSLNFLSNLTPQEVFSTCQVWQVCCTSVTSADETHRTHCNTSVNFWARRKFKAKLIKVQKQHLKIWRVCDERKIAGIVNTSCLICPLLFDGSQDHPVSDTFMQDYWRDFGDEFLLSWCLTVFFFPSVINWRKRFCHRWPCWPRAPAFTEKPGSSSGQRCATPCLGIKEFWVCTDNYTSMRLVSLTYCVCVQRFCHLCVMSRTDQKWATHWGTN